MKKIKMLDPLSSKNTLSGQLKRMTGQEFSSLKFHSKHNPSITTPAGVLVHKATGEEFFVPIKVNPKETNPFATLKELSRITKFCNGKDGFQWGDSDNDTGNFAKDTLDKLEELGLAKRTGKQVPNQLGGVWPEVEVTDLGKDVVNAYFQWRLEQTQEQGINL